MSDLDIKHLHRNYCYRLYPNRVQREGLMCSLDLHRELYNAALEERIASYERTRHLPKPLRIGYKEQADQLKEIREEREDIAWLNFSSCQQTLRKLEKAFQAFFRRIREGDTPGFPRFKGRSRFRSIRYVHGDGASLKTDARGRKLLYLQNIGEIKVKWHRSLPKGARIKQVEVRREGEHWYVSLFIEYPPRCAWPRQTSGAAVGLDVGLSTFAALSDGSLIENPRYFRRSEQRIASAQRVLSGRKKFSRRWRKASARVAKLHSRVARQRLDFAHQLSARVVQDHALVAVEDLNIQGLARSTLAKSVSDAAWGLFLQLLAFKAENAGSEVIAVDPRGSSQECSRCGSGVQKDLSVRLHECPHCGLVLDRDVNAARVLLKRALRKLESARTGPSQRAA